MLLRNHLYIGVIDVPDFAIRDQCSDFDPLISEEILYKGQAVLSGRVLVIAPLQKGVSIARIERCALRSRCSAVTPLALLISNAVSRTRSRSPTSSTS